MAKTSTEKRAKPERVWLLLDYLGLGRSKATSSSEDIPITAAPDDKTAIGNPSAIQASNHTSPIKAKVFLGPDGRLAVVKQSGPT